MKIGNVKYNHDIISYGRWRPDEKCNKTSSARLAQSASPYRGLAAARRLGAEMKLAALAILYVMKAHIKKARKRQLPEK